MARIRTIKPEFPQSETVGALSREARLLFILLWTVADDAGRARAAPAVLAGALYPFDADAKDLLPKWLDELEAGGAIRRYSVDGTAYLDIPGWAKHQRIDNAAKSRIPPRTAAENIETEKPAANRGEPPLGPRTLDLGPRTEDQEDSGASAPASAEVVKLAPVYAFEDGIIRLTEKDFELWKRSFSVLDVPAELIALSNWAQSTFGPKWFHPVKNALAKKNREEIARRDAASRAPVFRTLSGMDGIV